jgi:hypothetical protein
MITSSEVRTRAISTLRPGEELMFEGCSPRDGIPWTASVSLESPVAGGGLGGQLFIVDTCWSGDGAGVEPFTLRRTFTQAAYANNFLLTNC